MSLRGVKRRSNLVLKLKRLVFQRFLFIILWMEVLTVNRIMKIFESTKKSSFYLLITIGCLWGLVEAGAGVILKNSCARLYSGSILTGTAFLFFAAAYVVSNRLLLLLLLPLLTGLFRLYGAGLSGTPVISGAVANPAYALFVETLAFIIIVSLMKESLLRTFRGKVLVGIIGTIFSANMFLPVKLFTGIPACVVPGTSFPLVIWGLPVAIIIGAFSAPLGFKLGEMIQHNVESQDIRPRVLFQRSSLVVSALCFVIITIIYSL